MVTFMAILSFFLTYTLVYKYMLNKMLQDFEKPTPQSRIKAKPTSPVGHC